MGSRSASFPLARGVQHRHLRSRTLLSVLLAGMAVLTVALVLVAVTSGPPPTPRCGPLGCKAPPIRFPLTPQQSSAPSGPGRLYRSPTGFVLDVYPVFSGANPYPPVSGTRDSFTVTYPFTGSEGGQSQLEIVGQPDRGASAQAIVAAAISAVAPNSSVTYVVPGAYVGYVPGYGEVVTTEAASPNGTSTTYEVMALTAISRGFAITVVAVGALLTDVRPGSLWYNGHPSPAAVNVAYVADQTVNSIQFPR